MGFDLGSLAGNGFKIDNESASYNLIKNCSAVAKESGFYINATYPLVTNCSAGGNTTNLYVDPRCYHPAVVDFNEESYIANNNTLQLDLKAIYDLLGLVNTASSVSLSNTSEVTIKEWTSVSDSFSVDNFFIDFDAWATAQTGQTASVKVYSKVDGSNYRVIDSISITSEDDETGLVFNSFKVSNDFKITIQPSGNTTETIYYNYVARNE